jgi:branched-chain amino acid aminotransferase
MQEATDEPLTRASGSAWFNGAIGPRELGAPSVASVNFHLGTSVFDGLLAYWNRDHYYLHCAVEHLDRFRQGAARMGMVVPWETDTLLGGIHELLKVEPQGTQYIRPIAYRRTPELWVTGSQGRPVDICIFTVQVQRDCDAAIACHISPVERISSRAIPGHTKVSGAYVNSFNARRTAEFSGFQDGIMLDREGRITEASAANFFGISTGTLWTPPLNADVFPGVTRRVVIQLAASLGIECKQVNLVPDDLTRMQGAFLCSTLMEIRAVSRIGAVALYTEELQVYQALLSAFRALTHESLSVTRAAVGDPM